MRWAAVSAWDVLGIRAAQASASEVEQALLAIEGVSGACERILERAIVPRRAAVIHTARGGRCVFRNLGTDYRWHELLSVEQVRVDRDGDGVPETAEPSVILAGQPPYRALGLPGGYTGPVEVTGWWGMADEREPAGTLAAAAAADAAVLSLSPGHRVRPGNTLVIGPERCYVTSVFGNSATVLRGQRGTDAAPHSAGAPVEAERVEPAIAMACQVEAVRLLRDGISGYASAVGPTDLSLTVSGLYPAIVDLRRTYHPTGAVAV
jgi:hypothetical protein